MSQNQRGPRLHHHRLGRHAARPKHRDFPWANGDRIAPVRPSEIFYADRYAGLIEPRRPGTPVQIVPDVDHMGLIAKPTGIAAIVAAMR